MVIINKGDAHLKIQTINFDRSGMYRCTFKKKHFNVVSHIHQCAEIVYVTKGQLTATVGEEKRIMKAGEVAVIPPFEEHSFASDFEFELWLCVFSSELLRDLLPLGEIYMKRSSAFFRISDRLALFLDGALPDTDEEMMPFDYTAKRKITNVIFPIYDEYLDSTQKTDEGGKKASLLSKILLFLDEHYADQLSITDVSRALGYTPRHISRQLSLLNDYNFRGLLNSFRIEHAKIMIRTTDSKLIDISMNCGFVSERTFFRSFLQFEGMTPNEYRKAVR